VAALAALPPLPTRAREVLPADLVFDVLRKGRRIGSHEVRFRADPGGGGFTAGTTIDLAVKIAFVTAYRYRQDAADRWRDGRLVASDVSTDDDGERTAVRVREGEGGALLVEGPRGGYAAEPGTMTDLSFWNVAITRSSHLIDGQHGELMPVRVAPPVDDAVEIAGRDLPAARYAITTNQAAVGTAREGQVWYDRDGRWIRTVYRTRGELFTLRLTTG
jgi:hypothetical protein